MEGRECTVGCADGNMSRIQGLGHLNDQTEFRVDGVASNSVCDEGGTAIPNPDTIQEFKVQTGQYDASYGRNAGANVELVTKGGGNEFHGALCEFFRNDDLNANTFFNNRNNAAKPRYRFNTWGWNLGGPVYIPKLLARKDKLFFFFSNEYLPTSTPQSEQRVTVPTEAVTRTGARFRKVMSLVVLPLTTRLPAPTPVAL